MTTNKLQTFVNENGTFNADLAQEVKAMAGSFEDKVKSKAYSIIESIALDMLKFREKLIEAENQYKEDYNKCEELNKPIKEQIYKIGDQISEISTKEELKIIGALAQTRVSKVEIVTAAATEYTLYQIYDDYKWVQLNDLCLEIDNEEDRKSRIENIRNLIKSVENKEAQIEKLKEEREKLNESKVKPKEKEVFSKEAEELIKTLAVLGSSKVYDTLSGDYKDFVDSAENYADALELKLSSDSTVFRYAEQIKNMLEDRLTIMNNRLSTLNTQEDSDNVIDVK